MRRIIIEGLRGTLALLALLAIIWGIPYLITGGESRSESAATPWAGVGR